MPEPAPASRAKSRYAIFGAIASGGMATVHYGRAVGDAGFARVVAIKKLHPFFAEDPDFCAMLLDEGRMAARIRHPNVVATIDVVHEGADLFLVMEYVQGESLAKLMRAASKEQRGAPIGVAAAIVCGVLHGLHAAHEATDEQGEPLGIVHRDVSPQNILVGTDGVARVVDFGVAKATGRSQVTREGQVKGKLPYMAPEQLKGKKDVDRRADVWSAAVVFWELLTTQRLFDGDAEGAVIGAVLHDKIRGPQALRSETPDALDAVVLRGLKRFADERFATAREMARAIEAAVPLATTSDVIAWLESLVGATLVRRASEVARIEGEAPSRVITVTDVVPVMTARESRVPRALWVVGAAGLLGVGVAMGALLRSPAKHDARPIAPPPVSVMLAAPSSTPEIDPLALASASQSASISPRSSSIPNVRRPGAHVSPRPTRDPKCYTLDSAGIWHIKPECL